MVDLPDESVDAFSSFLQFQYTGDYLLLENNQSVSTSVSTETALPNGEEVDQSGEQMLKHARIYTLAEKLGLPALKALAHKKIHLINSTARGEIAYARYVYGNTPATDTAIRGPIALYWSQKCHVLRHEAEEEFKSLCLDVPEFTFDVLTLVLDHKEKRSHHEKAHEKTAVDTAVKGSGRKRMRS